MDVAMTRNLWLLSSFDYVNAELTDIPISISKSDHNKIGTLLGRVEQCFPLGPHAARRENAPLSEDAEQSAESNRDSRQTSAQPLHSLCLRGEWDTQRTNLGRKTSVPMDICLDLDTCEISLTTIYLIRL